MASIAEMITALTTKVDNLSTSWQAKLNSLTVAKDGANAAAANANAAASASFNLNFGNYLHIHAINGDDANDGLTPQTPVKTWLRLLNLTDAGRYEAIRIMSDLDVDRRVVLSNAPTKIYFIGFNDDATAVQRRKLRFVDDIINPAVPSGIQPFTDMTIKTLSLDIEMAYNAAGFAITPADCFLFMAIRDAVITRTGTGLQMFGGSFSGHFEVINVTIDPSASGHIIHQVPAGGDPNARNGISANFTTN